MTAKVTRFTQFTEFVLLLYIARRKKERVQRNSMNCVNSVTYEFSQQCVTHSPVPGRICRTDDHGISVGCIHRPGDCAWTGQGSESSDGQQSKGEKRREMISGMAEIICGFVTHSARALRYASPTTSPNKRKEPPTSARIIGNGVLYHTPKVRCEHRPSGRRPQEKLKKLSSR
jgi:hypothetical protein